MLKKYIILMVILICSFTGADFIVEKTYSPSFQPAIIDISVPNPAPPIGEPLIRGKYSRLPKNVITEPETVRVCAIRVQFQPDSTPTSTGNGQFIMEPDTEWVFDTPPHDKQYFQAHLEALTRYFSFVSDGKLVIEYTVFPEQNDSAYTLPDSMGYYGPDSWFGDDLTTRLAGFFTDAISFADSADTIEWCQYDVVIIFHAGSDWQNDVASFYPEYAEYYPEIFVPSPDDLPSAYIIMPDSVVPCVDRGIVLPESPSQDGQTILLNGSLAHEFGHALGLVDLYSTYDFYPMVGFLSLMDSGHNIGVALIDEETEDTFYVSGALPVYPSAWERAYLGWENVTEIVPTDEYYFNLRACELPPGSFAEPINNGTIGKIAIDEFEYFLLENRKAELWTHQDTVAIKQDSLTGVIQGIQVDGEFVGAYDFLLPGSGMLIWHIDERVAYGDYNDNGVNNFQDNHLQWDWLHPFIDLVEADGIQDIGMRTDEYGFGTEDDFYKWPTATHFGPNTNPNSQSYAGGHTGIDISDISKADTVMTFSFRYIDPHLKWKSTVGFPLEDELTIADLDNDSLFEILATSYGLLFIWRHNGEHYLDNADSVGLIIYDGDTLYFALPTAYEFDTTITSPSTGDIDGDGQLEIVIGDISGNLWALEIDSSTTRLPLCADYPINLGGEIDDTPLLADIDNDGTDEIIVSTQNGYLYVYSNGIQLWTHNLNGEFVGAFVLPDNRIGAIAQQTYGRLFIFSSAGELLTEQDLPVGDLNTPAVAIDDYDTIIVLTSCGIGDESDAEIITSNTGKPLPSGTSQGKLVLLNTRGELLPNFPVALYATPSAPVLANCIPSAQNKFEILFTAESLLYCYHYNGAPCENFPVVLSDDNFMGAPVIADFDGDSEMDIIAVSEESRLYGYDFNGNPSHQNGIPLAVGVADISPAIIDIDQPGIQNNHSLELLIGSYDGVIYCWNGFGRELPEKQWEQFGLYPNYNRVWTVPFLHYETTEQKILAQFYNYPNPVEEKTYFRYISTVPAKIELKIFDEAGNEIHSYSDTAQQDVPNEILWNTTGVSSGIYLAVLSANYDGNTEVKKHIVAIIK